MLEEIRSVSEGGSTLTTVGHTVLRTESQKTKVERDAIARRIFASVKDLARKLRRNINAYSAKAKPIRWKYSDLTRRIRSNVVPVECH